MNAYRFLILSLISAFATAADGEWREIQNVSREGKAWIDVSTAKFDGNNVIATYKWEYQGGTGFYLVSANCSDSTITQLGGEFRNSAGISVPKDPVERRPQVAPAGTTAGAIYHAMCDLRPFWRKWLQ